MSDSNTKSIASEPLQARLESDFVMQSNLNMPAEFEKLPYKEFLENTIVGIGYLVDRKFLWTNPRMNEIFGYNSDELIDKSVRILYTSEKSFNEVGELYKGVIGDGYYKHEREMLCKNGKTIWCAISGRKIRSNLGEMASVWVVQDISDIKNAEDKLRRLNNRLEEIVERRTTNLRRTNETLRQEIQRRREMQISSVENKIKFESLFKHMPLGLLASDARGELLEINKTLQTYLGIPTLQKIPEILSDTTRILCKDGVRISMLDLTKKCILNPELRPTFNQIVWTKNNGDKRIFSITIAAISGQSQTTGFSFVDITDQWRSREMAYEQQAALAHASRLSLIGQMSSSLAHELGQPLNACQSYLSGIRLRLADQLKEYPELNGALEKAIANLNNAGTIIKNVRNFASKGAQNHELTTMKTLIDQTISLMGAQLANIEVLISGDPIASQSNIYANATEIQQVLTNLLINAIDAIRSTASDVHRIEIKVMPKGDDCISVTVSDSGIGVPLELAAKIFEPYFSTKKSGLGMGLMLCKSIIEAHGGSFRLLPSSDKGASFEFTIKKSEK